MRAQTQYLAELLCTKLAGLMLSLQPQGQARGPHRVAFLGTTGTGKSFVLDSLLMLLCVSCDEYQQKADARQRLQLRERELLAQAPDDSAPANWAVSPAPVGETPLAFALSGNSQLDEDEAAAEPGSPIRGAEAQHSLVDGSGASAVDWAAEQRALAAFMSRVAWAGAADPVGARDAHMRASGWDAHSFLLRLSGGGTGTAKFLELADAPRFGTELTLRDPRLLVKELRDLYTLQDMCVRT